jgi:hypothetical protein
MKNLIIEKLMMGKKLVMERKLMTGKNLITKMMMKSRSLQVA